jgi:hypothetical protein
MRWMIFQKYKKRGGNSMLKHVEEMDFGSVEVVEDSDWRASKMGYKFNYCDDIWQLDGSITKPRPSEEAR